MSDSTEQLVVTINARGEIKGSASLPAELVARLTTPEAREQIRKIYKERNATGRRETRIKPRFVNAGERRDFSNMRPAGMSAKDFKRLRKQQFRKWTKDAIRQQRSNHGN